MAIFEEGLPLENWRSKYQYNNETPLQTYERVAQALAEAELKYNPDAAVEHYRDLFLKTMVRLEPTHDESPERVDVYVDLDGARYVAMGLKATPGGRITANAGTSYERTTLLNCFINSPVTNATIKYKKIVAGIQQEIECSLQSEETPDNLTNIFLTLLEAAETLKAEGGYGVNFGFIRPRGSFIKGVGIRHPGVVSYMELWDKMSEVIVKGDNDGYQDNIENLLDKDKARRIEKVMPRKGAMMAVLPCWHPDIEEYIRAKQVKGRLTKFNISVLVDDKFMRAVDNDSTYDLHFNGKVYKTIRAQDLYNLMMECAYNRNEPGILFFDNMNRTNPLLYLGPASASNPCEQHCTAGW